jgi:hypothetical protein
MRGVQQRGIVVFYDDVPELHAGNRQTCHLPMGLAKIKIRRVTGQT